MPRTDRNRLVLLPWIALGAALVALVWIAILWVDARQEAGMLRTWQMAMLHQIGAATSADGVIRPPTAADAPAALGRIVVARDTARGLATFVPSRPIATPGGTDIPDGGTAIARLRTRRSTGTAAGDADAIERDSRAAWTGWR